MLFVFCFLLLKDGLDLRFFTNVSALGVLLLEENVALKLLVFLLLEEGLLYIVSIHITRNNFALVFQYFCY